MTCISRLTLTGLIRPLCPQPVRRNPEDLIGMRRLKSYAKSAARKISSDLTWLSLRRFTAFTLPIFWWQSCFIRWSDILERQRVSYNMSIFTKIFGDPNKKIIDGLHPLIEHINALEPRMSALSDDELKNQTTLLRERLKNGEALDDIMSEAFAATREAARRCL